jgi:hypothetical protein
MPFTAISANDFIWVRRKNVALRPWGQRGRFGDVDMGDDSAGAADGSAEDGPEVVIGARVVLGASSGWVSGEEMALGARAEWSGVLTGFIVGSCGGSVRKSNSSGIGDAVGVGLGGSGERAGGGGT